MNFFKSFAKAIPLALGLVLTVISANLATSGDKDGYFAAIVVGLIGIPLAVASLSTFLPKHEGV
jgi:uncharacterized membrane protein YeaQ/YmgE (transglycosylase-associated protein family)